VVLGTSRLNDDYSGSLFLPLRYTVVGVMDDSFLWGHIVQFT